MTALILFQYDFFQLIGNQPLERFPAALSLLYLGGTAFVAFLLMLFVMFNWRARRSSLAGESEAILPKEVRQRLGSAAANRALWIFRVVFVALACTVYGFHVYWAMYAADKDPRFAKLEERDIRTKRVSASNLRGWILDRSGDLNSTFAFWKIQKQTGAGGKTDEDLTREYPLEFEMSHLLGTEASSPGLERTLFKRKDEATPEAFDVVFNIKPREDKNNDVRITVDREYQRFAYEQLGVQEKKGKHGAIVVLNPQTGDVLAVASTPTFKLSDARNRETFRQLEDNQKDRPLVSRATREFYVPGSTFKTFTMISAFRANRQNQILTSNGGGYVPYRNSRPIRDANGGCEGPFGCVPLNIEQAFEASSNQYFSQMAVVLGRDRLSETARLLGIEPADKPGDALRAGFLSDIWNASNDSIKGALALRQSAMVTGKGITLYDVALQGMGQGYAGQMTPFQMAMVAATAGNLNGNLMKPKIELERAPEVYNNVLTPQQAANVRSIMARVTEEGGGTGRVVASIVGTDIRVGGKTGTAEKRVPVYDPKTNQVKTITKKRRDKKGNVTEYQQTVLTDRTDSWFICIAPLENPQVAIAVVVEGGGFGSVTAAPIAANMIVKARSLGLLGEELRPKNVGNSASGSQTPKPRPRRRR